MKNFNNINDIILFFENKGNKNELFLKKEKDAIFIEFKVMSPSGKEELVLLEIKLMEVSDKELINNLLKKLDNLEKQIIVLNKEIVKVDDLQKQIDLLKKEITKVNDLEKQIIVLNKEMEILKKEKNRELLLDSKITNSNKIKFVIGYLKETENFKNKSITFKLLYRN